MINLPQIDIIIPNFNKGKYLRECLQSVINQTYKKWKIYIVDDCSTDNSREILIDFKKEDRFNITLLDKNFGPSHCRNIGIKNSTSNFIAFLDSDDFWPDNKLEIQIKEMLNNNYDFSYTDIKFFFNDNKTNIDKTNLPKIYDLKKFITRSTMSTSSIVVKRTLIEKINFSNVQHEDFLFKCQILKKGNLAFKIFDTFVFYRINKNNRSSNKIINIINLWKINRLFNNLGFLDNLKSIISISYNSFKTYGWK